MSLSTDQLDYPLPRDLIASRPVEPRDAARMLVARRGGGAPEHVHVRDLPELLNAGDALVFNTTTVIPARLCGARRGSGGRVEGLFVDEPEPGRWLVMLRSNGRLRAGDVVELRDATGATTGHSLELVAPHAQGWEVAGPAGAPAVLERVGLTPLPPYILKARDGAPVADDLDRRWYQTVYHDPRPASRHSVAAPTAGLHFTPDLLERLSSTGVRRIDVTLHVGPGTFRPISAATVEDHRMHAEQYAVEPAALDGLRATRGGPGRVVAVGSTAVRTLESLPRPLPEGEAGGPIAGHTDLLIAPPHRFELVDAMLTNFHLPRTTLLALVAAMVGLERLMDIYREAIERRYRFYSYGDAMLILP